MKTIPLIIMLVLIGCGPGQVTVGVGSDGTTKIETEGNAETTIVVQGDGEDVACSPAAQQTGVCI